MAAQTAIVIPIPDAEPAIGPLRQRFDPSAADGMPAHVTVLFPFLEPPRIDATVLSRLRGVFSRFPPFRARFRGVGSFPDVLYLTPEPGEAFRDLTLAVWSAFPQTPPYGGEHAEIVPHLTVGHFANRVEMETVASDLESSLAETPVHAVAKAVVLFQFGPDGWVATNEFALGDS